MIVTDQKILRQVSRPVTPDDDLEALTAQLKAANATAWTDGAGLAAIQIGVPIRFAWYIVDGVEKILVNPRIISRYDPIIGQEGCLSIPNKHIMVRRYSKIAIESDGQVRVATGFESRLIQHEIDHMDGILNIDKEYKPTPKVGRNEPCPCGSGKKYKKCCENKINNINQRSQH
jgi:peptide deformylase